MGAIVSSEVLFVTSVDVTIGAAGETFAIGTVALEVVEVVMAAFVGGLVDFATVGLVTPSVGALGGNLVAVASTVVVANGSGFMVGITGSGREGNSKPKSVVVSLDKDVSGSSSTRVPEKTLGFTLVKKLTPTHLWSSK